MDLYDRRERVDGPEEGLRTRTYTVPTRNKGTARNMITRTLGDRAAELNWVGTNDAFEDGVAPEQRVNIRASGAAHAALSERGWKNEHVQDGYGRV